MAVPLVLRAMAHERDGTNAPQALEKPESELLAVVLNGPAARVDWTVHEQLPPILPNELCPSSPSRLPAPKKAFAGRQRGHPDVVPIRGHAASTEPRRQDPNPITLPVNRTPHRFRTNHRVGSVFVRQPNARLMIFILALALRLAAPIRAALATSPQPRVHSVPSRSAVPLRPEGLPPVRSLHHRSAGAHPLCPFGLRSRPSQRF